MKKKGFVLEWFFFLEPIIQSKKSVEKLLSQLYWEEITYLWMAVSTINPSVLGKTADQSRPEIAQVMFKNQNQIQMILKEIYLKLEKK